MKNFTKFTALVFALTTCFASNLTAVSANDTSEISAEQTAILVDEPIPTDPTEEIVEAEPYGVIDVNQNPTKTEYAIGEELDFTNLKVTLRFFKGGEMYESELDDYEVIYDNVNPLYYPDIFVIDTSEFDSNTPGTYEITIKGTDEATGRYWMFGEGSFEVTVTEDGVSDWIPTNFEEALTFINTYGRTFVKDGFICTVRDRRISKERFETNVSGDYSLVSSQVYEWIPDVSDYDEDMIIDVMQGEFMLEVNVYKPTAPTNISISWADYYLNSAGEEKLSKDSEVTFEFEVAENGEITQTDIFGVIPDCKAESDSFIKENGNILACKGYLVFCGGLYTGGSEDFKFEQSGSGKVKETGNYDFRISEVNPEPWNAEYIVRVYEPEKTGSVTLTWSNSEGVVAETIYQSSLFAGETAPEWAPQSFEEAIEFANTYGRTLVKDGYICIVNETRVSELVCDYVRMYYEGNCEVVYNSVYVKSGNSTYPVPESDVYNPLATAFEVSVFKPTASGEIKIFYNYMETSEFTFNVDENGKITQTDIYGWMPDCVTEYESFVEKNGNVLVKDGYIGFVSEICTDGGYDLFLKQSGTGKVELTEEYNFCLTQAPIEAPGGANYMVEIYKPTTAGDITLDWTTAQEWDYDDTVMPICKKQFTIGKDLSVNTTTVKGDVDSDGEISLTDCISLKKYLTNKGTLTSLENADLNGDNKINVFDWCIFKKMLIK